jgi:hypothetical protein
MAAEHCILGGCDHVFTAGVYKITSTPRKEWMYIVGDEHGQCWECPEDDMQHGRRIIPIDECMRSDRVKKAGLSRAEVIALVMYNGPMVCSRVLCCFILHYVYYSQRINFFVSDNMTQYQIYNSILRQFPEDVYEVFKEAGNRFASTLYALASAVVKLSRVETLKPGTKLYRGMGGSSILPDSFYCPDEFGRSGFVENGFNSCTEKLSILLRQVSAPTTMKRVPTVMVLEWGAIDRPCSMGEFSQCDISSVP